MQISYADYILHPQLEAVQPEAVFNNFMIAVRSLSENKLDKNPAIECFAVVNTLTPEMLCFVSTESRL